MSLDASLRRSRHRRRMRKLREIEVATRADGPEGGHTFWQSTWIKALMSGGNFDAFKDSPWVHRAILTIVDSLKAVPFELFTGTEDDPTPVTAGPWFDFFLTPSTQLTRREFWGLTWQYTQLGAGDAFWLLFGRTDLADEREIPIEAQVLPGAMFEAKMSNGRLDHWMVQIGSTKNRVELHQVVQFAPIRDPDNPTRGVAPMAAAMRDIRTDDQAARWNEAILKNGAQPDGLITTDQEITTEQASTLKQRWNDLHQGAEKAGRAGVLGHGAKWQATAMSHVEMGFKENREWARQVVGTAFGVPMLFLNVLDDVHKETSRTVGKQLWTQTLIPKLSLAEDLLESRLFKTRGDDVWGTFDLSGIESLSEEAGTRRDNAVKDRAMGYSLNEINTRHDLGYEDQGESGDVGLVPFNLQTVDAAAATFDEEETDPPEPPSPPTTTDQPESDGEEDDEERAGSTVTRRSAKRQAMWERYVREVQRPGEKKMKTRILGWQRGRRADTLRWLGTADDGRDVRKITDAQIDAFLKSQHDRWHDLLVNQTKPVDTSIIDATLVRTGEQIGGLTQIDMTDPRILELIEFRGAEKVKTTDTMQKNIRRSLIEGSANGENIADLQERVRSVFRVEASRAQSIARTESAAASTQAKNEVMVAEGIEKHTWLSAGDGAERDTHHAQDGLTVNVGDPFPNGLLYPLDPEGPAEEVINCRCEAIPEV